MEPDKSKLFQLRDEAIKEIKRILNIIVNIAERDAKNDGRNGLHIEDSENMGELDFGLFLRIRTPYGKFWIDRFDNSYEDSVEALIHCILLDEKFYEQLLDTKQLNLCYEAGRDVFGIDYDDDEAFEFYQYEILDVIHYECAKHLAKKLMKKHYKWAEIVFARFLEDFENNI